MYKVNAVYARGKMMVEVVGKGQLEMDCQPDETAVMLQMIRAFFRAHGYGEIELDYQGILGVAPKSMEAQNETRF